MAARLSDSYSVPMPITPPYTSPDFKRSKDSLFDARPEDLVNRQQQKLAPLPSARAHLHTKLPSPATCPTPEFLLRSPSSPVYSDDFNFNQQVSDSKEAKSTKQKAGPKATAAAKKSSGKPEGPKKVGLYKTELCRSWEETGNCRYGNKCQFAHSREELRSVDRHPKYKTELCKTFWEKGDCPYGKRCCFVHTERDSKTSGSLPPSRPKSTSSSLDLRPLAISTSVAHSPANSLMRCFDSPASAWTPLNMSPGISQRSPLFSSLSSPRLAPPTYTTLKDEDSVDTTLDLSFKSLSLSEHDLRRRAGAPSPMDVFEPSRFARTRASTHIPYLPEVSYDEGLGYRRPRSTSSAGGFPPLDTLSSGRSYQSPIAIQPPPTSPASHHYRTISSPASQFLFNNAEASFFHNYNPDSRFRL